MQKTIELRRGGAIPALGLGTWKSDPGEVGRAVQEALRVGYRHIDCAAIYGNEAEIGAALAQSFAEGVVKREELWVTSKLWNNAHAPEDVEVALRKTLADLGLEYLDLYLIHWPVALRRDVMLPETGADFVSLEELPIASTWSSMENAVDAGLCRHIGVSNFSARKVGELIEGARIAPEVDQVELHPYLQQADLLQFCQDQGVVVTAYSPLGSLDRPARLKSADEPVLLEDPAVREIAARHDASPAQVLLAWALQRGTAVIPKSVHPGRMRENFAALELGLDGEDMQRLTEIERARRYISGEFWAKEGSPYTLAQLWN